MANSFEDREKGFEAKWAHDEELRFRVVSRRNKLFGLWAAREMGLKGAAAENYAKTLLDIEVHGGNVEGLAQKVRADFDTHKVAHSDHVIGRKMEELLAVAKDQIMRKTKA